MKKIILLLILTNAAVLYSAGNTANENLTKYSQRDDNYMKLEPYKSVDRIAKIARLNYNMDFPKKEQVKYLDKID